MYVHHSQFRKNRQMGDWWDDLSSGISKILEPVAKIAPDIAKAIAISQGKYIPTVGTTQTGGLVPKAGRGTTGMVGTGTGSARVITMPDGRVALVDPQGNISFPSPSPIAGVTESPWFLPVVIGGGAILLFMTMQKR